MDRPSEVASPPYRNRYVDLYKPGDLVNYKGQPAQIVERHMNVKAGEEPYYTIKVAADGREVPTVKKHLSPIDSNTSSAGPSLGLGIDIGSTAGGFDTVPPIYGLNPFIGANKAMGYNPPPLVASPPYKPSYTNLEFRMGDTVMHTPMNVPGQIVGMRYKGFTVEYDFRYTDENGVIRDIVASQNELLSM